jgi:hypothetical protein
VDGDLDPRRDVADWSQLGGKPAGGRGSQMKKARSRKVKPRKKSMSAGERDPKFAAVVQEFSGERRVAYGGKGFGSTALKFDGRIFAMLSSKGRFVVKLPRERVDELVGRGQGQYFSPGRGRLMKEWLAVSGQSISWLELAREAYGFASRGKGR